MKLEEYGKRKRLIFLVQERVLFGANVPVGDLSVRDAPTTEAGRTTMTVTPTDDGRWRADYWYSEVGGTHPVETATADSLGAAIAWAWWSATRNYRTKYVQPSDQQYDRETVRTYASLAKYLHNQARYAELARPHWADVSRNPLRLGLAAFVHAESYDPIAMRLARNPKTPGLALARMRRTTNAAARWQLAGNPSTPRSTLAMLRATADFGVRWYLAARPETTTAEIVAWAREDSALWDAVLARPDVAPEDLVELDRASSGALRFTIAGHPAAPAELLRTFAEQCDARLGAVLLESGRLVGADLDLLLDRSAEWRGWGVGTTIGSKVLPLDAAIAARLARSDVPAQRIIAAACTSLADELVEALTADPDAEVRKAVVVSARTPARVLDSMVVDESWAVRELLAGRSELSPPIVGRLALDESPAVRRAALKNPGVPSSALEALLDDPYVEIVNVARRRLAERG